MDIETELSRYGRYTTLNFNDRKLLMEKTLVNWVRDYGSGYTAEAIEAELNDRFRLMLSLDLMAVVLEPRTEVASVGLLAAPRSGAVPPVVMGRTLKITTLSI